MDIKVIAISVVVLLAAGTILYVGLWKFFYIDLTKGRWKDAKAAYPQLAQKMGLSFKPGELDDHIGEIEGVFNGSRVAVKPDESATVTVGFQSAPELFLSSVDPENIDPFPGMIRFDTENEDFDRYFQTRFAAPSIASALKKKSDALQFSAAFVNQWARPIQRFDVTRNGIEIRFKYGGQTYIPATVLESLLPDLCRFGSSFEGVLLHSDG